MALEIGDKAPLFVELQELKGKNVILYFYPKDNTPGCTKEACDFRDNIQKLNKKNTVVLGVSKDTAVKHQKFKDKYQLPFTLVADINGDVCESYGVINKKSLFGKTFLGINRSTFLIDDKGIIRAIWRKVKVNGHSEQVQNELDKLKA